jgi:uncharacterized protein (TIGR00251 family)
MLLRVKVTPNAKKNQIVGWLEDTLKVKIAAPAQKGKANKELIKFLAKELNVSRGEIEITKGYRERNKVIEISSSKQIRLPAKQNKLL